MKESRFIAQNKQKWQEAETLLDSPVKEPEKLGNLFVQVVDDLSFSRTYYPNRSVRVYLNKIARQYFSLIYSQKQKEKRNQFASFWMEELPQIMVYAKREMFIALLVFLLAATIGVFSSINDPHFVNTILGDEYVAMTNENIAQGDPMAVYKKSHQVDMFLGITFNNLMVAFRTYVLGIFLGIGTLASLMSNGVMVGAFQYFFIQRDLGIESASAIWLHGTLEISSIVLAGGAGLTLARGLIFPGTYSRLQSVQIAGIRSLKIMLGITPVFVLAAIIESFLTRYTGAPVVLKAGLILLSAVYIIGYFVVYPWMKSRSGFPTSLKQVRLQAAKRTPVDFNRIKNNAEVIMDTFNFYGRNSSGILSWVFVVSLCSATASVLLYDEPMVVIEDNWWVHLVNGMTYALETPTALFIGINALATALVLYRVMKLVDASHKKEKFRFDIQAFIQLLLIMGAVYGAIYLGWFGAFLAFLGCGMLIFLGFIQLTEESNVIHALSRSFELFWKNKNQGVSLQFIVLLVSFCFLLVLSAPLLYMHMSVLKWNFVDGDTWTETTVVLVEAFIKTFLFYMVLPLITAAMSYLYFSQEEANSATHLKEEIAKIGTQLSNSSKR